MARSLVDNQRHVFYYDGESTVCKFEFTIDIGNIPGIEMFNNLMIEEFVNGLKHMNGIKILNSNGWPFIDIQVKSKTSVHGNDVYDKSRGEYIALTKAQKSAFNTSARILALARHLVYKYIVDRIEVKYACECRNVYTSNIHLNELKNL